MTQRERNGKVDDPERERERERERNRKVDDPERERERGMEK